MENIKVDPHNQMVRKMKFILKVTLLNMLIEADANATKTLTELEAAFDALDLNINPYIC